MKPTIQTITLRLQTPFRMARGTFVERQSVLLHLDDAVGEGSLPPLLNVRLDDVQDYLRNLDASFFLDTNLPAPESLLARLPPGPAPARAAFDIALHDYWARRLGYPLYQLWGLDPAAAPLCARTLDLPANLRSFRRTLHNLGPVPFLKLKLGSGSLREDEAIVRTAREETNARLCVDANGAWNLRDAIELIPRLTDYDLLFIEQPIAEPDLDAWHVLRRHLPPSIPPLIADEPVCCVEDVIVLAGAADGINIKLTRVGGLREARRMITVARALDMKIALGCMIESSVSVTAAAHLASLADFIDLDAPLLLENDPYLGVRYDGDHRLVLPQLPGLGLIPA